MTWKFALEKQNKTYYVTDIGGRVKSVSKRTGKEKELVTAICNRYMYASGMAVHRLVAMAFVPNPDNKPYVDHIDGNRLNNDASNLRWVNAAENSHNPITKQRQIDWWTSERKHIASIRAKEDWRKRKENYILDSHQS